MNAVQAMCKNCRRSVTVSDYHPDGKVYCPNCAPKPRFTVMEVKRLQFLKGLVEQGKVSG